MFLCFILLERREREKKKLHARCFIDQSTTGCFHLTDQKSNRGKNQKNKKKTSDYEINCSLRKYVVSAKRERQIRYVNNCMLAVFQGGV